MKCVIKKRLRLILILGFNLFISNIISAQHTDHVPGDILLMLKKGTGIEQLARDFSVLNGTITGFKTEKNLSQRLNIWLLHFNNESINENAMLDALKQNPDVVAAQFNHYIE